MRDDQIGVRSALMWALYQTAMVTRELSRKANPSIYQSIYSISQPTLTCGQELCGVTERITLKMNGGWTHS